MPGVDDACPFGTSPGRRSEYKLDCSAGVILLFSEGHVSRHREMGSAVQSVSTTVTSTAQTPREPDEKRAHISP